MGLLLQLESAAHPPPDGTLAAAGRLGAAPPPFHSAECHPAVLVGGWLWIVCSDIKQESQAKETMSFSTGRGICSDSWVECIDVLMLHHLAISAYF